MTDFGAINVQVNVILSFSGVTRVEGVIGCIFSVIKIELSASNLLLDL